MVWEARPEVLGISMPCVLGPLTFELTTLLSDSLQFPTPIHPGHLSLVKSGWGRGGDPVSSRAVPQKTGRKEAAPLPKII